MLDSYYVLTHGEFMPKTTLSALRVPRELIHLVSSTDNPELPLLSKWAKAQGVDVILFDREGYLHDPYLSLMDESTLRSRYPHTATPARRFISSHEYHTKGSRVYGVFDDDVRFHSSNPFRLLGENFQDSVWEVAREVLQRRSIWACTFVNQFTWRGSYLQRGVPARVANGSLWHRTGSLSAQSAWVLSNKENHEWFSPILEDYITASRYAARGRAIYVLDEYAHLEPYKPGPSWDNDDPLDRDSFAYRVGKERILGVSMSASGTKPFKKYAKYIFPVMEFRS